jgi:hypothetical protein
VYNDAVVIAESHEGRKKKDTRDVKKKNRKILLIEKFPTKTKLEKFLDHTFLTGRRTMILFQSPLLRATECFLCLPDFTVNYLYEFGLE